MPRSLFISLPVSNLPASTAFYTALGFLPNEHFSTPDTACLAWTDTIQLMLLSHVKWRTLTQRPFPPAGSSSLMLSLALDSREAVDAMNVAAATHGGQADANPPEDFDFMYSRDIADPDGNLWAAFWMDPEQMPAAAVY